jgi:hypothetical protein
MKKILLIFIVMTSCVIDFDNRKLRLVNNTKDTIYYDLMPDTLLEKEQYLYKVAPYDTVWPHFVRGTRNGAWEYRINDESKDSTLHIFVFHKGYINDCIIRNHKFQRLDFKIKDLDNLKWIVVYE